MEKKNTTNVILIVILVIALVCMGGYIVYDKFLADNNDISHTEITDDEKYEALDITSEEVQTLYDNISNALNHYCGVNDYYTNKKVVANDLSNELVFDMIATQIYKERLAENPNSTVFVQGSTINATEVESKIKKLLGKDYKFTHKTYSLCPVFEYHEDTKQYVVPAEGGCGGTCGPSNLEKVVKAIRKDNTLEMYVRVLFVSNATNISSDNIPYYKDYARTQQVSDLTVDYNGFVEATDANIAKGSLYKLTFTKEDGNYVFTSSELAE